MEERRIEALKRMEDENLEAELRQESELQWTKVKTTEEEEGSGTGGSE